MVFIYTFCDSYSTFTQTTILTQLSKIVQIQYIQHKLNIEKFDSKISNVPILYNDHK